MFNKIKLNGLKKMPIKLPKKVYNFAHSRNFFCILEIHLRCYLFKVFSFAQRSMEICVKTRDVILTVFFQLLSFLGCLQCGFEERRRFIVPNSFELTESTSEEARFLF